MTRWQQPFASEISIHALLAESDFNEFQKQFSSGISIHALLAESDRWIVTNGPVMVYFYPRSPCGERPISIQCITPSGQFLSTLSLRRATRLNAIINHCIPISIHALLAESDKVSEAKSVHKPISIHALLAESDSCPPARPFHCHDFYPRSPCGERRLLNRRAIRRFEISIHALLAESDHTVTSPFIAIHRFLSTLSLRRATSTWRRAWTSP